MSGEEDSLEPEAAFLEPSLSVDPAGISASIPLHKAEAEDKPEGSWPNSSEAARAVRTPNVVDALVFLFLLFVGFLAAAAAFSLALHEHLFGLKNVEQAQDNPLVSLASLLITYAVAIGSAVPLYRMIWGRSFLRGLWWHGATARRLALRLIGVAFCANVLALGGSAILPQPKHPPIEHMFQNSTDAWLLFAFGVLVAPLVEEIIFRGFILPAVATAWDFCIERLFRRQPRALDYIADPAGYPTWSRTAVIISSLLVSTGFAFVHSDQVGHSLGPLAMLYCVSLILCTVRIWTKSLAASTLVHAVYNFTIFALLLFDSGGFRNLQSSAH